MLCISIYDAYNINYFSLFIVDAVANIEQRERPEFFFNDNNSTLYGNRWPTIRQRQALLSENVRAALWNNWHHCNN